MQQRLRLWRACVLSIAQYGLTAVGLDDVGATKYRAYVHRQLRIITGIPGHLTYETNSSLASRYAVRDPVHDLYIRAIQRVHQAKCTLLHLQGTLIQQRWTQLLSDLAVHSQNIQHDKGTLTEVTKVIRIQCSCNECGQHSSAAFMPSELPSAKLILRIAEPSLRPPIRRDLPEMTRR